MIKKAKAKRREVGSRTREALMESFQPSKRRVKLTPGMALHIYRTLQQLTQAQLAEMTGMKQGTISALEKDRITLGLARAKLIARALRVHPSVLAFPDWDVTLEKAA